ncbi:MAG: dihydrolipoyl dehydrogenase [Nitrospirae bacterium]|nr:dihydrolipoyl dehydrogenase [Nitrospirota bacterium]
MKTFDVSIIGGGPGGYVAAIKAAQLGMKTCLIEKDKTGGTCLHRGCIPTKSLLQSAHLYQLCKRSQEFGITTGSVGFDFLQIVRRKDAVVARLHNGVRMLLKKYGVEVIEAEGRLEGPGKVSLLKEGREAGEIQCNNVILATGSSAMRPSWIPFDNKYIVTSDEILRMEELPSSLIIAGGGDIGIEFAGFFNTLGTDVTVIEMKDSILPFEERDISTILKRTLVKRGIKILTETTVDNVTVIDGKVQAGINNKDGTKGVLTADRMLVALGRRPVTTNTGIEDTGIELHNGFVRINERYETSVQGVYAIGDIAGPPLLAHKASQEGIRAALCIAGEEVPPINLHLVPRVNYSSPQVASIGLTIKEAEEKGYETATAKFPFTANSKAIIAGDDEGGFVKIVADKKTAEILGVHMIGPEVSELIGGLSIAMSLEAMASDIEHVIFPHPTLSEVIKEAAHLVEGKAIHI